MNKLALGLLLFCLIAGLARTQGASKTPALNIKAREVTVTDRSSFAGGPTTRDVGDLLDELDMGNLTGDVRLLGVEFDGTDWYMTGARDYNGCYFYQVDYAATTVINMVSTGHSGWGWRDLAYDGTYLYASDSASLEQIDPATGVPTGTVIPGPISPVRAVAYDNATDTFWTASFTSDLYQFNRAGTILKTVPNPGLSIYGAAMEQGTNTLWWWSQDGSGTMATAMNPATGALTGVFWDGGGCTWPGTAGGACIYKDPTFDTVLAGMHQSSPDTVCLYSLKPDPNPQLDVTVNGGDAGVIVYDGANVKIEYDLEARQGTGVPVDVWLALKTPFGFFSYNGAGPYTGWNMGMGSALYTGPMTDLAGTGLDMPLPLGFYKVHFGIDTVADGNLTLSSVFSVESVDFEVRVFTGLFEDFDDGVADGFVPVGSGTAGWLVKNGTYRFDNSLVYIFDYHPTYYMSAPYNDFSYEVECTEEVGLTGYYYGMVLRGNGNTAMGDNYVCYFTNDGDLGFDVYVGGVGSYLVWTAPTSFVPGLMNWNTLKVVATGPNFEIYVNGILEASVTDSSHSGGYLGLFSEGSGTGTNHFHFDNLRVW